MNAVTVPSDTRVRARLERELSQESGGPKEGAASGVRRIEDTRGSPIKCGEPRFPRTSQLAASTGRPGAGRSECRLAQTPARSEFIGKIGLASIAAVERADLCPTGLSCRRPVPSGVRHVASLTPRWLHGLSSERVDSNSCCRNLAVPMHIRDNGWGPLFFEN